MKVKLKNGKIGKLVGDIHIIFDNGDGYSYTVPASDIDEEIKYEKIVNNLIDFIEDDYPVDKFNKWCVDYDNCDAYSCRECILKYLENIKSFIDFY